MTSTRVGLLDAVAAQLEEIRGSDGDSEPPVLASAQGPSVIVDGDELINLASNDYLGFAADPALVVADAEWALDAVSDARHVLLVTDGVFSMDGDIAPLPDLVELAESHGATVMVDDAHAIVFPTVAAGRARVRAIVTAAHTDKQLDTALAAFAAARDDLPA